LVRSLARVSSRRMSTTLRNLTEDGKLLNVLSQKPGIRLRDLREFLPQNKPSMIKLASLERRGQVSSVRAGLQRRFYCTSHDSEGPASVAPDAIASRIVREIEHNPGIWEARLSQNLGLSQQIVHYHLRKLQTAGFLSAEFEGKRKRYSLAGADRGGEYYQVDGGFSELSDSST
jgi:predicted transcriptional regulator